MGIHYFHGRATLRRVPLAALLFFGACAGERPELGQLGTTTTTTATVVTEPTAGITIPAVAAQAQGTSIQIFDDATIATPTERFKAGVITTAEATSAPGIPIVFLVKKVVPVKGRYEVYLPLRPNGSTGWVDADDVEVSSINNRIEVSLTDHRLRLFAGDEIVLDEPVGVGRADRPTPGGVYYVKELLRPPNQNGPYGTYAYGLSGFSDVLTNFNGGTGVIGIHGTNDPAALGTDVSSGCIRLDNKVISRIVEEIGIPLGTPVEILP
ncbi:MAG: murein L,D-transpeptidase [Acidimicrobiia bacterium]|nr:murein L,D-transpeptidase [Acidimicrobiia bacterium]